MKQQIAKSNTIIASSRCRHFTLNGRQCQLRALDTRSGLCFRHASLHNTQSDSEDLSADLLGQLSDFKCAPDINQFLARLLILVTQGRITPRRASVLAYITNQLLHSHRAIHIEKKLEDDGPFIIEFGDLPRPDRSEPNPRTDSKTVIDLPRPNADSNKKPS